MNQKSAQPTATTTAPKLHHVEDIPFSDVDTFPEFSNRDGSKETTEKCWQLTMIRVSETHPDVKTISESVSGEMRATWKTPPSSFTFFSAPHVPILHVAHGVARKSHGDKVHIRSSHSFAEPKNEKLHIAKESEMKKLKLDVILAESKYSWDKPESHQHLVKRIEAALIELMRASANLVLFLGPVVFDCLFEILDKQKRKSSSQMKPCVSVVVENFQWKSCTWKRVLKSGAASAQLKPTV